jgi:hypothetical protein
VFQGYPNGFPGPPGYKKWRFPSRQDCKHCHIPSEAGAYPARTILGFFPAQLKRAAPLQPAASQIAWLFSQGTFAGTAPNAGQLARRWKNIRVPVPAHLSP